MTKRIAAAGSGISPQSQRSTTQGASSAVATAAASMNIMRAMAAVEILSATPPTSALPAVGMASVKKTASVIAGVQAIPSDCATATNRHPQIDETASGQKRWGASRPGSIQPSGVPSRIAA